MDVNEKKKIIYTAYSKHWYFAKLFISAYVLQKDCVPLNPFTNWGYFMGDMVDRKLVVRGNNNLILLSDEVWCFGPIADGVMAEIRLAKKENKKVKIFSVGKRITDIKKISIEEIEFEEELIEKENQEKLINEIKTCL